MIGAFLLGCYTVGVAGLPVKQLLSSSGGSTPSQPTKQFVMSRTYRKVSQHLKAFYGTEIVKDGSRTRHAGSCERNGGCPYCESNRLHKHRKQPDLKESLKLDA